MCKTLSLHYPNKMNFLNLLFLLILLCIYRLPILASVSLTHYTPVLNFAPLLALCGVTVANIFQSKIKVKKIISLLSSSLIYKIIFISLLYFIFYFSFQFLFHKELVFSIARELSSTTIFLLFPLLLDLNFQKDELILFIEKLLTVLIIISFILIFGEFVLLKLNIFNVMQIHTWLKNSETTGVIRINTFMGQGAVSGVGSAAGAVYFTFQLLNEFFETKKLNFRILILIILALMTLCFCDSFTLFLAYGGAIFLMLWQFNKVISFKRYFKGRLLIELFVTAFIFYSFVRILLIYSGLRERFIAYVYMGQLKPALLNYLPVFNNCHFSSWFSLISTGQNSSCTPGEFHGLFLLFRYGIFLQLAWIFFYFYPLFFIRFKKMDMKYYNGCFYALVAILITAIHYSGAEIWGNNYLLGSLMVVFMKNKRFVAIEG